MSPFSRWLALTAGHDAELAGGKQISVEFEHQSQRTSYVVEFGAAQVADQRPKPFGSGGSRLLDEHACHRAVQVDARSKNRRACCRRGRRDQQSRKQQVIGLHDHRKSFAALIMASRTSRRSDAMNVTSHAAHPFRLARPSIHSDLQGRRRTREIPFACGHGRAAESSPQSPDGSHRTRWCHPRSIPSGVRPYVRRSGSSLCA